MRRRIDRSRATTKDSVIPGTSEERETESATGTAIAPIDVHGSEDSSSDDAFTASVERSKFSENGDPLKQTGEDLLDSESENELPIQQRSGKRKAASKGKLRRRKTLSTGKPPRAKEFPFPKESSSEGEDRADSENGSEDEPDQQRTRRRQSASKRQTRKAKQSLSRKESSEEEDAKVPATRGQSKRDIELDEKESEEDTDEGPSTTRKRKSEAKSNQTPKGAQSKGNRGRRHSKDSDDEFIVEESEEDEYESEDKQSDDESEEDFDDEEEAPLTTRKRKSKAQAVQTPRGSKSKQQIPSRASTRKAAKNLAGLDDDEEPVLNVRRRSKRSKDQAKPVFHGRRRSKRSKDDDDFVVDEGGDSEDHDDGDSEVDSVVESSDDNKDTTRALGRRQSPSNSQRQSPSRAAARKASQKLATLKDDVDDEDNEIVTVRNTRLKKRSDDDAYEENDSGESDEDMDDMADKSPSDDQSSRGNEDQVKKSKAVEVGDDFGTVDDSSSDDEKWASPQLKLKPTPGVLQLDRDDDSEADNYGPSTMLSPPKMPICPSKYDVITEEELPRKHVCYFSPDGSHRQCFALETLHKIALTTSHPKFRQDLTGGKQTFLQPPHFRSEMSDDLLDQIASRFGREALDLQSSFYSSSRQERAAASSESEIVDYSEALADSNHFLERVGNYVQSQMGSQDVRTCSSFRN
jgi:hypothetical protein